MTVKGIGKLIFTILSAVPEVERDRSRERIATVKQDQRARGFWPSDRASSFRSKIQPYTGPLDR